MEFLDCDSIKKSISALGLGKKGITADLIDFHIVTGKGKEKFIEGLGKPITFQGRNAAIVNIRDVTERKLAEEALKESEQKLADIIQFYPDATMVIDNLGKVSCGTGPWKR
jgi:PAS domain-containing protein